MRYSSVIRAQYEVHLDPSTYDWARVHDVGLECPLAAEAARILAEPMRRLESVFSSYRRVWFLGRDADVLYAYYLLRHSNVMYLPAMSRDLIHDEVEKMMRYVRALVRPDDLVVDVGIHGTVCRFVQRWTGADWRVLVGHDVERSVVRPDAEPLRALYIVEWMPSYMDGRFPGDEWRANVADLVEVDDGIWLPHEYWDSDDLKVAYHAAFVRTFVDTAFAVEVV